MPEAKVPWQRDLWEKVKAEVYRIENNYEMKNPEIQAKILEILKDA